MTSDSSYWFKSWSLFNDPIVLCEQTPDCRYALFTELHSVQMFLEEDTIVSASKVTRAQTLVSFELFKQADLRLYSEMC